MPVARSTGMSLVRCDLRLLLISMLMALMGVTGLSGCATTNSNGSSMTAPRIDTTLLDGVDLVRMTDQMAASLISSDIDFTTERFVIVADRVVNRSNHIMDIGEREHFLVRLRSLLNQNESLRGAGVVFVARPDEVSSFSEPISPEQADQVIGPTHALTATFLTLTTVDRTMREDRYECAFQLQHLASREVIWEDAYGVRYAVQRGRTQ